jgi:CheY-like chemotaxis protein
MAAESRILVVDDSDEARAVLAEILGQEGYTVHAAPDGTRAWSLLEQNWFAYDLVVTDLMMPGMSGLELLAKIRAQCPWIEVVLVSGRLDDEVTSKARALGAVAVLRKPCDIDTLSGAVGHALRQCRRREGR